MAAGSSTWQASPILVGMMSTSTAKRPPSRIAATIASTWAARSPAGTESIAAFTLLVRSLKARLKAEAFSVVLKWSQAQMWCTPPLPSISSLST